MNPNPHLLMTRAEAVALLQAQIELGSALLSSASIQQFEKWKTQTREVLFSMFDSTEYADIFSTVASIQPEWRSGLSEGLLWLKAIRRESLQNAPAVSSPATAKPPFAKVLSALPAPDVPIPSPSPTAIPLLPIGGLVGFAFVLLVGALASVGLQIGPFASPTPTPTPTPAASPTSTPPTRLEDIVASEVQRLAEGRIVFNPPTTMQQGKQERIEARITSQDIGTRLTEGLRGRGTPEVEKIKISPIMKVSLLAEEGDFQITKLSSEEQIVTGQPYAQWDWTVKPEQYGERTLHLKATAKVIIESLGERAVDVPVIDKSINVKISPGYIVKRTISNPSAWQIVLGGGGLLTIMSTIFLGIRRYAKNRKKRPAGF